MNNYSHIFDGRQPFNVIAVMMWTMGIFVLIAAPPIGFFIILGALIRQRNHMRRRRAMAAAGRLAAQRRAELARIRAWKAV